MLNHPEPSPLKRTLEVHITELLDRKKIVVVTGPMRVGKTAMLKRAFPDLPYVSLSAAAIRTQPAAWSSNLGHGAIIDDIDEAPDVLPMLLNLVRQGKARGPFLLAGNHLGQAFGQYRYPFGRTNGPPATADPEAALTAAEVSVVTLLPCTLAEYGSVGHDGQSLREMLLRGGYPEALEISSRAPAFYAGLVESWIREKEHVLFGHWQLSRFRDFLFFCAEQIGRPLNMSQMARELGNSQPTVRRWVQALPSLHW